MTFLENPNNLPDVNHKDENPLNNHVSNLEFCTHEYNMNYGTINERKSESMKGKFKGENNPMFGKHHTEKTKQKMCEARKGKPNYKKRKSIQQFTLNGEFIRDWDSATLASKKLNLSQGNITQCCNGKRNKCGGFIWRYKE